MTASRLVLVGQGATAETRVAAFPRGETSLSADAAAQLPRLRSCLGWHEAAIAAPSRAAQQTAAAVAGTVSREPDLRDCDCGVWTGPPAAEIAARDPEGFARWLRDPYVTPHGGEAIASLIERVGNWLSGVDRLPGNGLVVASPFVIRAAVVAALALPLASFWAFDPKPLGITRMTAQARRWRLSTFNADG